MPSSEQEMRERAREKANKMLLGEFGSQMIIFDQYYPQSCDMYKRREAIADDLCSFAILERGEAIEECAKLVAEWHDKESSYYNNSPSPYMKGQCRDIAAALRAKLTPAPEAEKEGKNAS